jgi:nicotinamidase-related amidase
LTSVGVRPLDLSAAALLTSECQNGVIGAESVLPELAAAAAATVIANGARLCAAARAAGAPVVHCVAGRRTDDRGSNRNARLFGAMLKSPVRLDLGTPAAAVVSVNVAVTNLVMDAVNRGYQVVLPRDAVCGVPAEYADAAIDNTLSLLATVTTADEVLGAFSS